jgi:hypothetical protein
MATLVLAAADTTPAPAATTAAAPAPAAAAQKPKAKDTDTVCWTEAVTGSHYPHRVCSTRAELEERQRRDQQAIADHGRAPTGGAFGKSGP